MEYLEEKTFHYLSASLFDDSEEDSENEFSLSNDYLRRHFNKTDMPLSPEESSDLSTSITDSYRSRDKFGNFDETYGQSRYGAMFMDLLSTVNLAEGCSGEVNEKELASMYLVFYNLKLNISANLVHRVLKIYDRSQAHSYARPYSSLTSLSTLTGATALSNEAPATADEMTTSSVKSNRPLLTEALAKRFEKYLPLRTSNFILKEPLVVIQPFTHLFMSSTLSQQHAIYESTLNLQANFFNLTITSPIYEQELFDTVTKMVNPPKKLVDHSYTRLNLVVSPPDALTLLFPRPLP